MRFFVLFLSLLLPSALLANANGAGSSAPSSEDDTPATAAQAAQDEADRPDSRVSEGVPMDSNGDADMQAAPTSPGLIVPPFEAGSTGVTTGGNSAPNAHLPDSLPGSGSDAATARHDFLSGSDDHP